MTYSFARASSAGGEITARNPSTPTGAMTCHGTRPTAMHARWLIPGGTGLRGVAAKRVRDRARRADGGPIDHPTKWLDSGTTQVPLQVCRFVNRRGFGQRHSQVVRALRVPVQIAALDF